MRILFTLHRFYPDFVGGTEQHALDLARELQARGHTVAVFYRAPGPCRLQPGEWEGVPVYRAQAGPMTPFRLFAATFFEPRLLTIFRQVLQSFNPDCVYLAHLMGLPVALVDEVHRRGIPLVISLHDYWWVCANANLLTNDGGQLCDGPRAWINCARCGLARMGWYPALPLASALAPVMALRGYLLRACLKRAHRILVFSDFVHSWYLSQGVPTGKIVRVSMGVRRMDPLPRRTRPEGGIRFCYAGGIAPLKGLHVLVEAFCSLDPTAELWIAGDLGVFPEYVRHLQALARHPRIRFLSRVGREELWPMLADADAVVVPSLWHETFSMLAHEAFVVGTPVIASALGALPEIVWHEENGLLLPPGDVPAWAAALRRFASDPTLRARLRTGIPPVRTFTEYVNEMEDILGRTVERHLHP